jgi:DNA-binding NarL/FixJ family response regulator
MIRVLIADDHAIVRSGLRALLDAEPGMELVGEAAGGYEAIQLIEQIQPDVLVLDLNMPDLDGIAVTNHLKPRFPNLRILILTVYEDEALLREAIRKGASGYVLKRATESELVTAIQTVERGDLYVDPKMVRTLLDEKTHISPVASLDHEPLSPREKEVLALIVQGYTNRQIGEKLSISVRTVEGHRANLSAKLGLRSRVELVRYAREHGLIE